MSIESLYSVFSFEYGMVPYYGFAVIDESDDCRPEMHHVLSQALDTLCFTFLASYFQDLYSNIFSLCGLIPRKTNRIITKLLLGREVVEVSNLLTQPESAFQ
jgi:hypothetical protein